MALSKDKILKHTGGMKTRRVKIEEWADENGDCDVIVRGMSLGEFEANQAGGDSELATARVIAACVQDEGGMRVFKMTDAPMIANLPLAQTTAISRAIMELSGLMPGDDGMFDEAKAIKDAEGNSEPTPES